jgi:predicted PhzF superfamily epimerase YddE/YHI9
VKCTFHIVDVFSPTPFGGNQLAVLPDAAAISTEGMQNIAREFNFGETAFVLPKNRSQYLSRADRAAINRAAWAATLSRAWSPHIFFFAGNLRDGGKLYARMWAPALGVEEDPATGSACAAVVGAMASKHDFDGTAYRLSIQQGVSMGRRSEIEAEARKSGGVVTSVSVGGAHGLHRQRRNRGSAVRACVLVEKSSPL